MRRVYTLSITHPDNQTVVPTTVAAVLRAAADIMEWYQSENEPRVTSHHRVPGVPAWTLTREKPAS